MTIRPRLLQILTLSLLATAAAGQVTSQLWGVSGEAWNPTNSPLRNFTDVGYMNGDVPIPDWPVGVNVTNFGAIANDDIDDSQAFIDAIAACPDYHAVFVPNGRYIIEQRIKPQRDHFVLRGEDMYETVLFMPKYLNEIYITEKGWHPDKRGVRSTGVPKGFFRVEGGTERSLENLTFEMREQRKMSTFAPKGSTPIDYSDNVSHSWIRNIYIKNADEALRIGRTHHLSVINIVVDNFIQRKSIYQWSLTSLFGITAHGSDHNLCHNLIITNGGSLHGIDLNNVPNHNVFSRLRFNGSDVSYHGSYGINDLFTDTDAKAREMRDEKGMTFQTYWCVRDQEVTDDMYNSANNHLFVGYGDDRPEKITSNIWYEPLDPLQLTPRNIYLAQLEYFGKPLPEGPPPPVPSPHTGDVIRVAPTDDNVVASGTPDTVLDPGDKALALQQLPYLRYDLTGVSVSNIAAARLRCNFAAFGIRPYRLSVWSVTDDSWSEDTLTYSNRPPAVSELDSEWIDEDRLNRRIEFDVTSFVTNQLTGGDPVISFNIMLTEGNGFMGNFRSREDGLLPELVIERVADPVPGAPGAPKGIGSTPLIGNIVLDWDDNPEPDVATYNVYRSPTWSEEMGGEGYQEPIAEGLTSSDYVDISAEEGWHVGQMDHRIVFKYMITAVDEHGYESPRSLEFVAATLHPSNAPPAFSSTVSLPNVTARTAYSESLADKASDPESDQMYFMKVSGPDWLNVAQDGTLSGTPDLSDVGTNTFMFQVTAIGGSTQQVVNISVDLPADDPPGAPAAPAGLTTTTGDSLVSLDWNDNSEGDLYSYSVYRSTTSGSGYSLIATGLSASGYVDDTAVNDTTYYYVVTALDANDNESANSSEVSAAAGLDTTPPAAPTGLTVTPYAGTVGLNWNENSEADLSGYSVYRSTTSGSYSSALVTGLSTIYYIDNTVSNGTTYYYSVTATDTNSNESVKSYEVSVTPSPSGIIPQLALTEEFTGDLNNDPDSPYNMTDRGQNDWKLWSGSLINASQSKIDGSGISDLSYTAGTGGGTFSSGLSGKNPYYTWTDGTPIASVTDTEIKNMLKSASTTGTNDTISFTAAASSGPSTLYVVAGAWNATVEITGSLPGTTHQTGQYKNFGNNPEMVLYKLVYTANSENDVLTVSLRKSANDGGDSGYIFIQSAALTVGEPVALTGYDLWASGWSTNIGAATNDFDLDGLDNLYEYGVDGNPTNGLDRGTLPSLTNTGGGLLYIHPQRSDDETLVYTVETTTNLVDGIWTNDRYTVTGTNVTGETLDFVTNDVDTAEDERFIRLKIAR